MPHRETGYGYPESENSNVYVTYPGQIVPSWPPLSEERGLIISDKLFVTNAKNIKEKIPICNFLNNIFFHLSNIFYFLFPFKCECSGFTTLLQLVALLLLAGTASKRVLPRCKRILLEMLYFPSSFMRSVQTILRDECKHLRFWYCHWSHIK